MRKLTSCTVALLFLACGEGDDGPTAPSGSTVGPEGGIVRLAGGAVTLIFPSNAISREITVTAEPATSFPDDIRLVGGSVYRLGPEGTTFDREVTLRIEYDPADVPAGLRESELRLYEVVGNGWQEARSSVPLVSTDEVSGRIDGFSSFGALGVPVASLKLNPDSANLLVGTTLQMSAILADQTGVSLPDRIVTWSSSAEGFAPVDETGLVTGVSRGLTTITAASEGLSETAQIFVVLPTRSVVITSGPTNPRQGDVVTYTAEPRDSLGNPVEDESLSFSLSPASAGVMMDDGRFVGYTPGPATVIASASNKSDSLEIEVVDRGLSGSFSVAGRGEETARFSTDLWVHGNYAYLGTFCCTGEVGDRMFVWDISAPAAPVKTDSVVIPATVTNDVKVKADGSIAVATIQANGDGGIVIMDLADPAHPSVITTFREGLTTGVHNVWVEGDYVYAVANGRDPALSGLKVIDISVPSDPAVVASFLDDDSFLHDVYVRDGLAFLSHWNVGLIILDVGGGGLGGSPADPRELGRVLTAGGQTHNAWYWPATGYVFVGEEDGQTPGTMHVVDASDLRNPQEVATFGVPGDTPHNFWLDEERAILYVAWYSNGIRALDVSGELVGELDRQGREIASLVYDGGNTRAWAPQLHDGLIFLSDIISGLWVFEPIF